MPAMQDVECPVGEYHRLVLARQRSADAKKLPERNDFPHQ
jgi:hypothetical protein